MTPEGAAMAATVREMDASQGFDAVVVCTSNVAQERYWQTRLQATAGQAAKSGAIVVAVHEDWAADGAGNGLGTLYAYAKAKAKAQASGHDLDALLARGGTVGIYHTAGKGTRLAPLPGAENNNKPGVKLPSLVDLPADPATGAPASTTELTILEAVVRQTGVYAKHRPGRCSVFWGDQIFVPSAGHNPSGAHHADILAQMGPMPDEADWKAKGLDKYGLIAVNAAGEAAQVEKVSYDTATRLLAGFGQLAAVGPSLGSFSLGAEMLSSLMTEFAPELEAKTAKMDSDPHVWMPMTLEKKAYVSVMVTKDETEAMAGAHWDRMAAFKAKLLASHPDRGLFGAIDVGEKCYWWDYGQLGLYRKNNALAMEASEEAAALREYLKIPENGRVAQKRPRRRDARGRFRRAGDAGRIRKTRSDHRLARHRERDRRGGVHPDQRHRQEHPGEELHRVQRGGRLGGGPGASRGRGDDERVRPREGEARAELLGRHGRREGVQGEAHPEPVLVPGRV